MRTTYLPPAPARSALSVDQVQSAHFWCPSPHHWTGVVGIASGQELDVVQVKRGKWYASDDDGTRHYGRSLPAALRKAIKANRH